MTPRNWLRVSYWTAAVADFVTAVLVLSPGMAGVEQFVYPQGLASVVAFSWGILLILADNKPFERRWALIPTMIVVALLGFVTLYALVAGYPLGSSAPYGLIASVVIFALLAYSYQISAPSAITGHAQK